MELKNFTIEDYLLKRKNGESNYDIFAQVVSNQGGSINYFGTICCNKQETSGLVDIFSIDKIIEQFDGEEFLKVATLYKQYMELADAQDQDLTLRKAVLDELNKYGLPVSLHEIKNEITKRSVQIPTGDELVDRLEKLFFEFESDYDDCNGDFYLMKAKEAQRKGVDN